MAETVVQRHHLAYCISELHISEKGLKKLNEMIKNIKLALQDEIVFDFFRLLLSKAKKSKSSAVNNDENSDKPAPASTVNQAPLTASVSKASIEEVEKALLAAIQENNNNSIDGSEGGLDQDESQAVASVNGVTSLKASGLPTVVKKALQPRKGTEG
jgi:hypothetical protein